VPLSECRAEIIESALAGPQEGFGDADFYPTLASKTSVLAYRLIKGHACVDGNKRLALILASAFLEANGHDLEASGEEIDHVFRHVAASESGDHDEMIVALSYWFERAIRPLTREE
jgi:death on curing protein